MLYFANLNSGFVQATGTDRIDFLHGQVTNDIKKLPTPGACAALLLNVKGQIEFELGVHRKANELILQTAPNLQGAVLARLKKYVVFDDVQLQDVSQKFFGIHFFDDQNLFSALTGLGFKADAGTQLLFTDFGELFFLPNKRTGHLGFDVCVSAEHQMAFKNYLMQHGQELNRTEFLRSRILANVPDAHNDNWLGMLPQECGLEDLVSYKKGCYVGQEIMARLEARGQRQRSLCRVVSELGLKSGAVVLAYGGKHVGRLGAVVHLEHGTSALAVLRHDAVGELTSEGVVCALSPTNS